MKIVLSLLGLLAMAGVCAAQATDSIPRPEENLRDQIMGRTSTPVLISNGRQMVLESFLAGDMARVAQVRNYLMYEVQNTSYRAFTDFEYLLLLYWTADYPELTLNATAMAAPDEPGEGPTPIMPAMDELTRILTERTDNGVAQLESSIDRAGLIDSDRDFLKIFMHWILVDNGDYNAYRDITAESQQYLAKYPNSHYRQFLEQKVEFHIIEKPWGFGWSIGVGPAFVGGGATEFIRPVGFSMTMVFDAVYRKLYMGLGLSVNGGGIKSPVTFGGIDFIEDDSWTIASVDARLGYQIADTKWMALAPYASVGYSGFAMDVAGSERIHSNSDALSYGAGIYWDIKLAGSDAVYAITGRRPSYTALRLRYNVSVGDYRLPRAGNTVINSITIEWGGFGRAVFRAGN